MKKRTFFTCILFLLAIHLCAQVRSNRDLVGKWQGPDMQLEFFSDSRVILVMPGGKLPVASYSADFMQNPIAVTITLTDNGQKLRYRGSLQFINNETIKLEYFGDDGNNRNNDAFAKGKTVTLKRRK